MNSKQEKVIEMRLRWYGHIIITQVLLATQLSLIDITIRYNSHQNIIQ